MKHRILIFAEAVTLAHVGRPLALARSLERLGHEVVFACSASASRWLEQESRAYQPIETMSAAIFRHRLARGVPLYDRAMLIRYVQQDIDIIERNRPDFVIGDFRLSLYISSRLCKLPYGAIANAYWSPDYFQLGEVPDLAPVRWFGVAAGNRLFRLMHRPAFRWHARALIAVCRHFGVQPPATDLLTAYTASDVTAFADVEEFYTGTQKGNSRGLFLGPLHWAPTAALPTGHDRWGTERPLVYVSMGSSGRPGAAGRVLSALADVDADVVVATAGTKLHRRSPTTFLVDYAPGDTLCERAALVIGNGGSLIGYQALAAGTPLLGLPSNMDQFLNMRVIERTRAARWLRADASPPKIRHLTLELLHSEKFYSAAKDARSTLGRYDVDQRVSVWLAALGRI